MLELGKKRNRQSGALLQLGRYSYNRVVEELIVRVIRGAAVDDRVGVFG